MFLSLNGRDRILIYINTSDKIKITETLTPPQKKNPLAYLNYFHGSRIQPFCLFLDFVLYGVVYLITHKPKAHNIVLYFCKTKRFFILRTIIEQIRTKTSKDDYLPIPPCHKVLFPLLYHSNLTMITIFNVLMNYIFLITSIYSYISFCGTHAREFLRMLYASNLHCNSYKQFLHQPLCLFCFDVNKTLQKRSLSFTEIPESTKCFVSPISENLLTVKIPDT